jgi:hypothetical protein
MPRKRPRRAVSGRRKRMDTVRVPRTGAPAVDSVRSVVPFSSPTGRIYQIIKTTEVDAYDTSPGPRGPKRRGRRNR